MTKKGFTYVAVTIISLGLLIYFIFAPKKYETLEKTISADNKEIYIVREETYLFNKPISEWGIMISTLGVISGIVFSCIEYKSNKKRTEQEKGAEVAKMFATEIINKLSVIIQTLSISKLGPIIKKTHSNVSHTYSVFECSNFDRTEMRRIYGEKIYDKYDLLKKEKDLQILYTKIIKAHNDPYYSLEDIKKELSDSNTSSSIPVLEENDYYFANIQFPKKFSFLICDTLNELEYLCMYISSNAANSEFIYQSLHQTFLDGIRLLALEISYSNTNSSDKVYTNIIHVYNDWLRRYSKAQKEEEKNIKKSNKILNPKIKTIS